MKNQKERIESLRKTIVAKKERLGVNSSILYLKGLKKYNNLEEIKYPKSVNPYQYYYINDKKDRFKNVKYPKIIDINKNDYVFTKIVNEVAKKVILDFRENTEELSMSDSVKFVNNYIKEKTYFTNISVEEATDEKYVEFAEHLISKYGKVETKKIVKLVDKKRNIDRDIYSAIDNVLSSKVADRWYSGVRQYLGMRLEIISVATYIAKGIIVKSVSEYMFKDESKLNFIKDKISKVVEFDEEEFLTLSGELMTEIIEDNNGGVLNFLKTVIVLAMEEMLKESFDIYQYEERLKSISGDYAKTYMTKKNIPKKTLAFMENNNFLNMFGYVEADEDCEITKLESLSEEFIDLSKKLFLPIAKDHSLRFRKLGKIKANGVYYPGFNTLAVDLDGVSSFVHEMMHMIDFENNILSLDYKFKPLLNKYRTLMDEYVLNNYGKDSDAYNTWHKGKSKYNRSYYASNEEAFARMGELYVTDVLNIETSFSKIDYSSDIQKIVYPKNAELLDMIKDYFNELFANLKNKGESVVFEENKAEKFNIKVSREAVDIKNDSKMMENITSSIGNATNISKQLTFF